jgi:hypothetical protein
MKEYMLERYLKCFKAMYRPNMAFRKWLFNFLVTLEYENILRS